MSTKPAAKRKSGPASWARLGDEKLLDLRFCDLGLTIADSPVAARVCELYEELKARRLRYRPPCWLSSDWFSPNDGPGIAIPFYLAHPRLMRLEDRQMFSVEGGTKTWCMQLLRHEAGQSVTGRQQAPGQEDPALPPDSGTGFYRLPPGPTCPPTPSA